MATNNAINLKSSGIASYDGAGTFSALANPLTVANGGTGDASLTAYAVICGGTTSTGNFQSIAGVGTSGQVLTSNGASLLPTFQAVSGGTGYVLYTVCTSANPADGQTYFLALGNAITTNTTSGDLSGLMYVPKTGTITACVGNFNVAGTLGSAENATLNIRLNNTTDTAVTSTLKFNAIENNISNTALSIAVTAGDYLEFKLVCPTWATNPTTVRCSLTIYIA